MLFFHRKRLLNRAKKSIMYIISNYMLNLNQTIFPDTISISVASAHRIGKKC